MPGFGGSPTAALLGGLGSGVTQGVGLYQQLLDQQLQRERQRQIMELAAAQEGRASEMHPLDIRGKEADITYRGAATEGLQAGTAGTRLSNTEAERLARLRTELEAGAGEMYGLGGPDLAAQLLGQPTGAQFRRGEEVAGYEAGAKKYLEPQARANLGYTQRLSANVGAGGGGGGLSQSDANALGQARFANEPLGSLLEAETVYLDRVRAPGIDARSRAQIARELNLIQSAISDRLKDVPKNQDELQDHLDMGGSLYRNRF